MRRRTRRIEIAVESGIAKIDIFVIAANVPVVGDGVFKSATDKPADVIFVDAAGFFVEPTSTGEGDRLIVTDVAESAATGDIRHEAAEGITNTATSCGEVIGLN